MTIITKKLEILSLLIILLVLTGCVKEVLIERENINSETSPKNEKTSPEIPQNYTSGRSRYSQGQCENDANCFVGGCSAEVCANTEGVITTCEILPDFPDKTIYECGCVNNTCGWRLKIKN